MPRYDFKCDKCEIVEEKNMPFLESEKGYPCPNLVCSGTMIRQFTPCANLRCGWNPPPYRPGMDAREDRKRAFISQEEKGLLPKGINEKNANFADLM